jgi:acyl-CoA thioester hydrolase
VSDRHPAERLETGRYPFSHEIRARFGDMDVVGHLNNVAVAAFYEDARVAFLRWVFDSGTSVPQQLRLVAAEVRIRYLAEAEYPGAYQVRCGIGRLGTSSLEISAGLFRGGRPLGLCDSTMVHVGDAGPVPIPAAHRAKLEAALFDAADAQPAAR